MTTDAPPLVQFGREICGDRDAGLRREWLVTNGLGGYASGTVAGPNTRRYHGLLVAALEPPVKRTVLVSGLVEWATYAGARYPLSTHEYGGEVFAPLGYRHLQAFELDGMLPVWTFALGDGLLERRVWMHHGANTTYITYRLVSGTAPVQLAITPLVTYRDFHSLTQRQDPLPQMAITPRGVSITAFPGAVPYQLLAYGGCFEPEADWYYAFHHREEAARGLDCTADLFAPGRFTAEITATKHFSLVLTTEKAITIRSVHALAAARARQQMLIARASAEQSHPVIQQLVLAADQFMVQRGQTSEDAAEATPATGKTIIAGYHWFNDWGRDTMIALPGLALATGRAPEMADILRTFAAYVVDGLLPNNFPDSASSIPGYNTADATLWFIIALHRYVEATGDSALVRQLTPTLRQIIDRHLTGTRYHIGVDPQDGLLRAGEAGVQLTWMDAKVGDWVVTPRIGKPVEINALWYNALRIVANALAEQPDAEAATYAEMAERVRASFRQGFLHPAHRHLADVVDGPDGDDWSLRPNQLFAVVLPYPLIEGDEARQIVEEVGHSLATTFGLRSLSPDDEHYLGAYQGDQLSRDGTYHQGTVWAWLMGSYVEAYAQCYGNAAGLKLLQPFEHHLRDAGLGSISEIFDGDPPHVARGCIAQAWSVAEILRVWRKLDRIAV